MINPMITGKQYLDAANRVQLYNEKIKKDLKIIDSFNKQIKEEACKVESKNPLLFPAVNKNSSLMETNLSVRCLNILRNNAESLGLNTSIIKIKDLSRLSITQFMKCRNAGEATLLELTQLCFITNVKLKP